MKRTSWTLGMIAAAAATAVAFSYWVAEASSPGTDGATEVLEEIERNCWDRSQWGYPESPDPIPGRDVQGPCEEPELPLPQPLPPEAPWTCQALPAGTPVLRSHDWTSNRMNRMPVGTLQVITFYDGRTTSRPTLRIGYATAEHGSGWIDVTGIRASTSDSGQICTFEYDLDAAQLTGAFEITGIERNGVIDGLAFGLFWRDVNGFHALRSTSPDPLPGAAMVGTWPIGLTDDQFARRTTQLSRNARQQAKSALYGAEYLSNGSYLLTIEERAVRLKQQ
jgi:hypothetical protein